jgi:hypothetical protein
MRGEAPFAVVAGKKRPSFEQAAVRLVPRADVIAEH